MKLKLLFVALMTMTLSFAQEKQVDKIIDNSKDGVSTVYNDGKEAVSTVYKDVKSMSPKVEEVVKSMSPKVEEVVKSLAEQFKTTTNALWNILVKQQLVWSICFLILTLTSIFNWWLFYKKNFYKLKESEYTKGLKYINTRERNPDYKPHADKNRAKSLYYLQEPQEILIPLRQSKIKWFKYLHLVICITLSVFSFYHFSDMLTGFFNPEYGALQTIMKIATKL
jgi:hypothetical protein